MKPETEGAPTGKGKIPTIGVLLDHIESEYHVELIFSALRTASRRGAGVLVLPGGALGPGGKPGPSRGFLYGLLNEAPVDGLLVLGGTLSNYCGHEDFEAFLLTLPQVPRVVVGFESASSPSISADNEQGIDELVDHLATVHERKRIAYIDGPLESDEARVRREAYLTALRSHGHTYGDELVVAGGLSRENGVEAVEQLLQAGAKGKASIDAIIGVNDDVALGVLQELKRRGVPVPESIAVVGFDDTPNAHAASPPLTTVSQRVFAQGESAMDRLLDELEGGVRRESEKLDAELVVRQSCGCGRPLLNQSAEARGVDRNKSDEEIRAALVARVHAVTKGRLGGSPGWEEQLVDSLVLVGDASWETSADSTTNFVAAFVPMAQRGGASGFDVCHELLTELRKEAFKKLLADAETTARFEDAFQEARLALAEGALFLERERSTAQVHQLRHVIRACLKKSQGGDAAEFAATLERELPLLGLGEFVICRFASKGRLEVIARAGSEWTHGAELERETWGVDPRWTRSAGAFVLPLSAGEKPVGLASFGSAGASPFSFELLRDLLGAALGESQAGVFSD